jgi:hypothetical protein
MPRSEFASEKKHTPQKHPQNGRQAQPSVLSTVHHSGMYMIRTQRLWAAQAFPDTHSAYQPRSPVNGTQGGVDGEQIGKRYLA